MDCLKWSRYADSNRRPTHYECVALPTELYRLVRFERALKRPWTFPKAVRKDTQVLPIGYVLRRNFAISISRGVLPGWKNCWPAISSGSRPAEGDDFCP
jgi:hypothetical protein